MIINKKLTDKLSEILLYFIIIFSPLAFGTTENWSSLIINLSCYSLGILAIQSRINNINNIHKNETRFSTNKPKNKAYDYAINLLIFCMIMLFFYILISYINARASYDYDSNKITYKTEFRTFLPHSYDQNATLNILLQYIGLLGLFAGVRHWLNNEKKFRIRISKLIYMLVITLGVIGFISILQRQHYSGNDGKLLFLLSPKINTMNIDQYGPYAYRSNACTIFNMIWPIGLGFYLQMSKKNLHVNKLKIGQSPEFIILIFTIIIAICPIISSARGGYFIMLLITLLILIILLLSNANFRYIKYSIYSTIVLVLLIGYYVGYDSINLRIERMLIDNMSGRTELYTNAISMIQEYNILYGAGPGAYQTVVSFDNHELNNWPAWVHSDYLEFLLTYGIAGSVIIFFSILLILAMMYINLRSNSYHYLILFSIISMIGLLTHAIFDFPLQVHSILIYACIIASINTIQFNRLE